MMNSYYIRNMWRTVYSNKLRKKCIYLVLIMQVYHHARSRDVEKNETPVAPKE